MEKNWFSTFCRKVIVEKFLASVAYYYFRFVGKTTRWQDIIGAEDFYGSLEKYGSIIVIAWHGRTLEMPYFWDRAHKIKALVSPSRDGNISANILAKYGIENVKGSTNKNAFESALALMRDLKKGSSIAIIPDGPRGPSMQLKMSPLFYAKKSGKPILAVTYSFAHAIIISRNWDDLLLPLPFCKGIYAVTKPYFIPADATSEQMEEYRQKIEDDLNNLTWDLDKKMGLPYIAKGKVKLKRRRPAPPSQEK